MYENMRHRILSMVTSASGLENEDRGGALGAYAWVIDGATDVGEGPLTSAATDASWVAEVLDLALRELAAAVRPPADDLSLLPAWLSEHIAVEFDRAVLRAPRARYELPSASGLVVRTDAARLDYVAVGDCTLLAETGDGFRRLVTSARNAGDPEVAEAVAAFHATRSDSTASEARAHVWPRIREARASMNLQHGYGVLSVTETPARFVIRGGTELAPGGHALLATDGLMRLVDVYRRYSAQELLAKAEQGLDMLVNELRAIEASDEDCRSYPRAKPRDDATAVLLRREA